MKAYVYLDNSKGQLVKGLWKAPVVFMCTANTITEADQLFHEKQGKPIDKCKHVGCQIYGLSEAREKGLIA